MRKTQAWHESLWTTLCLRSFFSNQTSPTGSVLCRGTGNGILSQEGKPFLLAGPYWPHSSTVKALNTFSACSHSNRLGNSWDLPFPSVKYFSAETCRHQRSVDGCLSGLWEFSMGISQQGTVSPPYRVELFWLLTLNGKAPHIREKHVWAQLVFQTEVPCFLDESLWPVSEQLRKLNSFTSRSKNRLSQSHLHVSVYSQLRCFCCEP